MRTPTHFLAPLCIWLAAACWLFACGGQAAIRGKDFGDATADALSSYRNAIESMRTAQEGLLKQHARSSTPGGATPETPGFGSAAWLLISHEEMAAARTRVGQACGVDTR